MSFTFGLILFILGFGFLVFVHELGHFLVAKWVGIKCTQFAIGFGPSIVAWRKGIGLRVGSTEQTYERRIHEKLRAQQADTHESAAPDQSQRDSETGELERFYSRDIDRAAQELGLGETEYRLNYVPLGGYVKMLGQEDLDPTARSNDPRAYGSKPIWARACVISAGVVMNILIGALFFVIAFSAGVQFPPAVVGDIMPGMPAATTYAEGHEDDPRYRGLRVGDTITHVQNEPAQDFMDIQLATALGSPGEPVRLTVRRPGRDEPLRFVLDPQPAQRGPSEDLRSIGVAPPHNLRVIGVAENNAVTEAGVRPGMDVVNVDGQSVTDYGAFYQAVTAARGKPVAVTFQGRVDPNPDDNKREKIEKTVTVEMAARPELVEAGGRPPNLLGLRPPTEITFIAPPTQPAFGLGKARPSPADKAGLQAGDVIASLNGQTWPGPTQVQQIIGNAVDANRAVDFTVLRDGQMVKIGAVTPRDGQVGIGLSVLTDAPLVASALADSPAAALDALPGGSRLVKVAGERVSSWGDVQRVLASSQFEASDEAMSVSLTYEPFVKGAEPERVTLTAPRAAWREVRAARWSLPPVLMFDMHRELVQASGPVDAAWLGVTKTGQYMAQVYVTLLRLFQGTVEMHHLRGPVGIVDAGARVATKGWTYMLFFLGLISVNLAVINFLPIPIVDGGHILFLLIEKLKGSPVSVRVQAAATYLGLALIGVVFIVITYFDIARQFQ